MSTELNYLALTFLQNVAIFEENKNDMAQLGVIEKAAALLDCPHHLVQEAAARVLYNLSFDTSLRYATENVRLKCYDS